MGQFLNDPHNQFDEIRVVLDVGETVVELLDVQEIHHLVHMS